MKEPDYKNLSPAEYDAEVIRLQESIIKKTKQSNSVPVVLSVLMYFEVESLLGMHARTDANRTEALELLYKMLKREV